MNLRAFAQTFVTLVVIMDPLGNIPLFIALTRKRGGRERSWLAVQAAAAAGALVAGFALFGQAVLAYLHVSTDSLSIAGGLLLLLVALESFRGETLPGDEATNIALVPLATPLLAGPGAIAAVMVLSGRYTSLEGRIGVIAGIVLTVLVVGVGLSLAAQISRLLRPAAVNFLSRVLALLLSAIAVQLISDAVVQIVRSGG
ncbi:MAG TPA: MarC family protein [Candidatus Acidoferrales bacterium]|nr:MarC family protein [Candidatus Acidoferrales bacterium]